MNKIIVIVLFIISGCASVQGPISGKKYFLISPVDSGEKCFEYYDSMMYDAKNAFAKECLERYVELHPEFSDNIKSSLLNQSVIIGMNKEQLMMVMGKPHDVNRTAMPIGTTEQWIYQTPSGTKYFYFQNDLLFSWQD